MPSQKKINFYVVPFKNHWVFLILYPPRIAVAFLFSPFCDLRTQLGNQVGGVKILPDRSVGSTPCLGGVLLTTVGPQENCPSLSSFGYLWRLLRTLGR